MDYRKHKLQTCARGATSGAVSGFIGGADEAAKNGLDPFTGRSIDWGDGIPTLPSVQIEDIREGKWPWWWGGKNWDYITNPVTRAVIDGQNAGARVIAEVGSLLLPVPKIGLLARGYRFLRGARAAKGSSQGIKSLGAAAKGFSKVKTPKGFKQVKDFGYPHGQKVYKHKGKYYSRDIDGHNGGVWKVFENAGGKLKRIGTTDANLKIFKN